MQAKSSNQLTFSWQSNGGTTNVERTQYQVELKGNLFIYIYKITEIVRVIRLVRNLWFIIPVKP